VEGTKPHVQIVSKKELRHRFNKGRYWHRVRTGEGGLYQTLEEAGHPSPPLASEPICTCSQILAYRDDGGRQIARVHQYERPDGSIGGTRGEPDPKELLEDDVLYIVVEPSAWQDEA
jgi:hypothetical protein